MALCTLLNGVGLVPAAADSFLPNWPVEDPFVPGGCPQPDNFLQFRDQSRSCLFTSEFATFSGINLVDSEGSRVEARRQGTECVSDTASRAMCVSRVDNPAGVSLYGPGRQNLRFVPEEAALSMGGAITSCARNGPPGPDGFTDVAADAFYADAVAWLKAEGITTGTSATTYAPDNIVTRGQMAEFLHRMATNSGWTRPT